MNVSLPIITIVTINYQNNEGLLKTIRSVSRQVYPHIEHIIVDGNSEGFDRNLIEAEKKFPGEIISECDNGIYDAMNKGILYAKGDYIGFLNSGDVYCNNSIIEKVVHELQCDQSIIAIYSNLYFLRGCDVIRKWKSGVIKRWKFWFGWMAPHPTLFMSAQYLKINYFDVTYKIAADYDLILRSLYADKIKTIYLDIYTVAMEAGGVSNESIASIFRSNIEVLRSWKKNIGFVPAWILILKPLRKIFQLNIRKSKVRNQSLKDKYE